MLSQRVLTIGAHAARGPLAAPLRAHASAARPVTVGSAAPLLGGVHNACVHHQHQQQQQRRSVAVRAVGDAAAAKDAAANGAPQLLSPRHSDRLPIVLLAGWLGAAERPFLKYVDLWERRIGASNVLRARPNPAALIVPAFGEAVAARDAAALAAAADQDPSAPVLLHLFSGGGFLYSALVLRALARSGALRRVGPRIAAAILDSSPAYVTSDVSARALVAAALREPADGVDTRHPRLLGAVRGAVDAYLTFGPTRRRLERTEAAWHELVPPCPKLYLYSESDVLVSPDTIQSHMAAEAVRGARVYAHRWADTPHVEHYRLHPDEYARVVARFTDEALDLADALSSTDSDTISSSSSLSRASSSSSSGSSSGGGGAEAGGGAGGRSMW